MKHTIVISTVVLLSLSSWAQPSDGTSSPVSIDAKEMLLTGPAPMKLHALSRIINQLEVKGVDESYLPGLKVASEEKDELTRLLTAKLLGKGFIEDQEQPNAKAVALLVKLGQDDSFMVRYNAAYYGLAKIQTKTPEVVHVLLEIAATDRDATLNEAIATSLTNDQDITIQYLNEKVKSATPINYFEIYEQFTGMKPKPEEHILDMPSSKPIMFVFLNTEGKDSAKYLKALKAEMKKIGMENVEAYDSGETANFAVMLKTYITRDRVMVENHFSDHDTFPAPQIWWLTPELEISFDEWRKK